MGADSEISSVIHVEAIGRHVDRLVPIRRVAASQIDQRKQVRLFIDVQRGNEIDQFHFTRVGLVAVLMNAWSVVGIRVWSPAVIPSCHGPHGRPR
jgi:hypothetical protein